MVRETEVQPNWRCVLAKIPIFASFGGSDLDRLAACAHERRIRRGETLMRAGDPGLSMVIVIAGEVRVDPLDSHRAAEADLAVQAREVDRRHPPGRELDEE